MRAVEEVAPQIGTAAACRSLGVSRATLYRRRRPKPPVAEATPRPKPPRSLSDQERRQVLDVLDSEPFADQAPAEVYAALLDQGQYLCSIRTMYRILDEQQEVRERRNQLRRPNYPKPQLVATAPNQVWSWDITKLLGPVKWTYFYLYVILDIFSRYVVGWMLAHRESEHLAERLIRETLLKEGIARDQLTIHSDRGPSMRSQTVAQLLATLGITKSHSRPHVSDDNPFSESQFKTMKYRPEPRMLQLPRDTNCKQQLSHTG
jgi:putative transposase